MLLTGHPIVELGVGIGNSAIITNTNKLIPSLERSIECPLSLSLAEPNVVPQDLPRGTNNSKVLSHVHIGVSASGSTAVK
jgi:hypothetical protein